MKMKKFNEFSEQPPPPQGIRIEFHDEKAQEVCIAGTFNDWRPTATPMMNMGRGRWVKDLALAPGRYEYRLVIDGHWSCDPSALERVPNPFGGFNAIISVAASEQKF